MRVLMAMGDDAWTIPGGHKRQLLKTADALRTLGLEVRTEPPSAAGFEWADVLHGFRLGPGAIRDARSVGCAVAVSPIYNGATYAPRPPASTVPRIVRSLVRRSGADLLLLSRAALGQRVGPLFRDPAYSVALGLESADVLLPNAEGEANAISRELGVTTPSVVVPNAVDPLLFRGSAAVVERGGDVIYVGRIEPHKNQLGLIRALKGTPLRLTIVGPAHPHHLEYHRRCVAEADESVTFIGEREEKDLPALLQGHRVHALPSVFETTGLVSLEAALCGCAVVSTDRGWASEYLGRDGYYCSPWSLRSIRAAVTRAFESVPSPSFAERVERDYSWDVTAACTLEAYERALAARKG